MEGGKEEEGEAGRQRQRGGCGVSESQLELSLLFMKQTCYSMTFKKLLI